MSSLQELKTKFANGERIVFEENPAGFIKAILRTPDRSECQLYLHGATIISWRDSSGQPILFESSKLIIQKGKALRAGIPLVFPQFGGGPLPSHGFARVQNWEVLKAAASDTETAMTLGLKENEETLKIWPHPFSLELKVVLGKELHTTFIVHNKGNTPIEFQNAFHTYFTVGAVEKIQLPGFQGLSYLDNLKNKERSTETRTQIPFAEEIDRVYLSAPNQLEIPDPTLKRKIVITKQGLSDAVVWNPWIEKSKSLNDLAPDDYKRFVCVETGNVGQKITVQPGDTWSCTQRIQVNSPF